MTTTLAPKTFATPNVDANIPQLTVMMMMHAQLILVVLKLVALTVKSTVTTTTRVPQTRVTKKLDALTYITLIVTTKMHVPPTLVILRLDVKTLP
jgi:hypothetical protein